MKVYASPVGKAEWPNPFSHEAYNRNNEQYIEANKAWLRENGFDGPNSGDLIQFGVADGYAQYMFADKGRQSFLIHLDIGDGYQYRDVEFLPKKEILRRIEQCKSRVKLFGRR